MIIINDELLDEVSDKAIESSRLRMNYNFHKSKDSKAQRLLNALEPGTILPVHRHRNTSETYILLRGSLNVILYSDKREVIKTIELNQKAGVFGVDIPVNQWHTIEVLEPGTIIFEVKDGPYMPISDEDVL